MQCQCCAALAGVLRYTGIACTTPAPVQKLVDESNEPVILRGCYESSTQCLAFTQCRLVFFFLHLRLVPQKAPLCLPWEPLHFTFSFSQSRTGPSSCLSLTAQSWNYFAALVLRASCTETNMFRDSFLKRRGFIKRQSVPAAIYGSHSFLIGSRWSLRNDAGPSVVGRVEEKL